VLLILNAIFPMFIIMALGFFASQVNLLGEKSAVILSKFVYYFALPCLLFIGTSHAAFHQILNIPYMFAFAASLVVIFFLILIASNIFTADSLSCSSLRSFAFSTPNTAYMGIPIITAVLGQEAIVPIAIGTLLTTILIVSAVILVEISEQKHKLSCPTPIIFIRKLCRIVLTNPIVLALILGVLSSYFKIFIPFTIDQVLHTLAAAAIPTALFAIGQTLSFNYVFKHLQEVSFSVIIKLILQPIVVWVLLYLLNVQPFWTIAGVMLVAMPTANMVFVIAEKYQVREKQTSAIIFATTIFSLITLPIILYLCTIAYPNFTVSLLS